MKNNIFFDWRFVLKGLRFSIVGVYAAVRSFPSSFFNDGLLLCLIWGLVFGLVGMAFLFIIELLRFVYRILTLSEEQKKQQNAYKQWRQEQKQNSGKYEEDRKRQKNSKTAEQEHQHQEYIPLEYKILKVTPQDNDERIKEAYKKLAKKFHPDKYKTSNTKQQAHGIMVKINEAYEKIKQERGMI